VWPVRRARAECAQRRVDAALGVADMRALPFAGDSFDAVVCVDKEPPSLKQLLGDGVDVLSRVQADGCSASGAATSTIHLMPYLSVKLPK
jgi:hypothetical protein